MLINIYLKTIIFNYNLQKEPAKRAASKSKIVYIMLIDFKYKVAMETQYV